MAVRPHLAILWTLRLLGIDPHLDLATLILSLIESSPDLDLSNRKLSGFPDLATLPLSLLGGDLDLTALTLSFI